MADLRLLSLAEAGQLELELIEADLGDLVRRLAERLRPAARTARRIERLTSFLRNGPAGDAATGIANDAPITLPTVSPE